MRIKTVRLKRFKRFTDVTVGEIPASARLIIIAGPNGCGKSSFFEGLHNWAKWHRRNPSWEQDYHIKSPELGPMNFNEAINIEFHGSPPVGEEALQKAIYVRTAYRNDPEFTAGAISRVGSARTETRFQRMIDNDQAVGMNYQRLVSQALEDVFEKEMGFTTIDQFRDKVLGEISAATTRLFPDLIMNSLGNPLSTGSFKFTKGTSRGFLYKNLSGGEKAAFDLMLDMLVKRREFDNTVFCIDEPEVHMNSRLQGKLLEELFRFTTSSMQLWLATHSVGMMRKARDLALLHPGQVVFLDYGDRDFDNPQTVSPEIPSRSFWEKVLDVAFDDMAALIAPAQIILCEGSPVGSSARHEAIDAACYNGIFSQSYPDVRFVSVGNSLSVESDRLAILGTLRTVLSGVRFSRLVDRDDLSPSEVSERHSEGVSVLKRRHLESYLFDDEILSKLCLVVGKSDLTNQVLQSKESAIQSAVNRGKPVDDMKSASGQLCSDIRLILQLSQSGNTPKTFMRDTLAPLVPNTAVYDELEACIFGVKNR